LAQDHPSTTSVTLLGRLRHDPADQAAWSDFVARYGPKIHQWCRRWRLQEADAQDVAQDVLLKLHGRMANYTDAVSGSFRAWLKTLTHHAWRDLVAERRRAGIGTGDTQMAALLNYLAAGEDLAADLQEEFRRELLEQARARVKARMPSHTWGAFRLTALEGSSGATAVPILVEWVLQEELRCRKRRSAPAQPKSASSWDYWHWSSAWPASPTFPIVFAAPGRSPWTSRPAAARPDTWCPSRSH
jgi:RNA polymerase sigma-70 factor (ECF subfamily)